MYKAGYNSLKVTKPTVIVGLGNIQRFEEQITKHNNFLDEAKYPQQYW